MARRVLPSGLLALTVLSLAGCSNYERPQRAAWRGQAENACIAEGLVRPSAFIQPARPIEGPSVCGLDHPFKVSALASGTVAFNSTYTLGCPMIAALEGWLAEVVQPAAQARFGVPVVQVDSMGSYSCRGMNGTSTAHISEHAFGNAMDIGGFRLADGRTITIVRDWSRGDEQTQAFLRDVHGGSCSRFTTVLGPGYNAAHYNHFHVDLAMHGNTSTGPRRICRPTPHQTIAPPDQPRDGLPDAPEVDEDVDMAQAGPPAMALHDGPSLGLVASVPPAPPQRNVQAYSAMPTRSPAPAPTRGALREDGAFVPEGVAKDWDLTSSIARRDAAPEPVAPKNPWRPALSRGAEGP